MLSIVLASVTSFRAPNMFRLRSSLCGAPNVLHNALPRMSLPLPLRAVKRVAGGFVQHGLRRPLCARRFCGSDRFSHVRRALHPGIALRPHSAVPIRGKAQRQGRRASRESTSAALACRIAVRSSRCCCAAVPCEGSCLCQLQRGLTARSTGRAGSCFDLRRAPARRAGYLAR